MYDLLAELLHTFTPTPSLPTETLAHILSCASESLSPPQLQAERISYSQVCRSWRYAFQLTDSYVLDNSSKTQKLVSWLNKSGTGPRVRRLDVTIHDSDKVHSTSIALLLHVCKGCRELALTMERVEDFLLFVQRSDGGRNVLENLIFMERFKVKSPCSESYCIDWIWTRLLFSWPRLIELQIEGLEVLAGGEYMGAPALPRNLRQLSLLPKTPSACSFDPSFALSLIQASHSTLTELKLGIFNHHLHHQMYQRLHGTLQLVAPRLRVFELLTNITVWYQGGIKDGFSVFQPLLALMINLEDLALCTSCLEGPGVAASFFLIFARPPRLRKLTLSRAVELRSQTLEPAEVVKFLKMSSSIRALTMSKEWAHVWSTKDWWSMLELNSVAKEKKTKLSYAA